MNKLEESPFGNSPYFQLQDPTETIETPYYYRILLNCSTCFIILYLCTFILSFFITLFTLIIYFQPSINFIVLGSFGINGTKNQTNIARALGKFCSENRCDFIITTGNNFYPTGTTSIQDPQFSTSFLNIYDQISLKNLTWYPVLGKTDYMSNPQSQVDYMNKEKRWSMNNFYYSLSKKTSNFFHSVSIQFTMMDTIQLQSYNRNNPKINQTALLREGNVTLQNKWIIEELNQNDNSWHFLVGYDCVYGFDYRGNYTSESKTLKNLLKQSNIQPQIYFCGEFNSLQMYQEKETDTLFAVSGSAGFVEKQYQKHIFQKYYLEESGFLYVRTYPTNTYIDYIIQDNIWKMRFKKEIN